MSTNLAWYRRDRGGLPEATSPARLPDHRGPQTRDDRAARGPGPAPRRIRDQPQGAEVLALRRRAAARLTRPGRCQLAARMDLAPARVRAPLPARRAAPAARREHAVLPVEPGRAP